MRCTKEGGEKARRWGQSEEEDRKRNEEYPALKFRFVEV